LLPTLVGSLRKAGRDDGDAFDALLTAGFNGFFYKFFRYGANGQIDRGADLGYIPESGDTKNLAGPGIYRIDLPAEVRGQQTPHDK